MPFIQIYTYAIASKEVEKPQWTSNRDVHLQYWWLLQHESTPASAAHVAPSFPQETPGESQGLQDFIAQDPPHRSWWIQSVLFWCPQLLFERCDSLWI